jgi:hypothetical protein
MRKYLSAAGMAAILCASLATAAHATDTTFLYFGAVNATNVEETYTGGTVSVFTLATAGSSTEGATPVSMYFSEMGATGSSINTITADLTFSASAATTPGTGFGEIGADPLTGTFDLTLVAPLTIGKTTYATGTTILSGSFADASYSGTIGGTTANIGADITDLSSGILKFQSGTQSTLSFEVNSLAAALTDPLNSSDKGTLGGSFASNPLGTFAAAVPEPTSWALMLVGVGGVGGALRRRRVTNTAAA